MIDREKKPEVAPIATHACFENDDVKVWEMDLAPGEMCGMHRHTRDYVLYILEGGRVKLVEKPDAGAEHTREAMLDSGAVFWHPRGAYRNTINVGERRYRELRVEFR
jgi:mannose-6-phosphate isomerase-like protein (cupin superfamily)